jgi:hypothetical protein
MYKYLSIAPNLQEMMVMLGSLPACTIVFDQNEKIIEINQPALDFLQVKSLNDYRLKKWIVLNDTKYLKKIIHELKVGKIVKSRTSLIRCPDYHFINVNICACMLTGVKKVFVFQFFELRISLQEYLDKTNEINSENERQIKCGDDNINELLANQETGSKLFHSFVNEDKAQLLFKYISFKYPYFTNNEILICILLALRKTTSEIAAVTKRKPSYISYMVYKILKVFNVRFRKDLSVKLIDECSQMQVVES